MNDIPCFPCAKNWSSFFLFCRQTSINKTTKCVTKRRCKWVPSAKVASSLSLSFSLFRTRDATNKLDQTDSRWVVRVVWIRALLRTDSNLRSWVDFSLGHRQIYLAAAVDARFTSLFLFYFAAAATVVAYRYDKNRDQEFLRIMVYFAGSLYSFVIH